jgi:hypothetical protein
MHVRALVLELTNKVRVTIITQRFLVYLFPEFKPTIFSIISIARNTSHHNSVAAISHKYYVMSEMDIRGEESFLGAP